MKARRQSRKKQPCGLFFRAWAKIKAWPTKDFAPAKAGAVLFCKAFLHARQAALVFVHISAVVADASKKVLPLLDHFFAAGLDDCHDVAKDFWRDLGVVVCQIAPAGFGDPDLGRRFCGRPLRHMDMDGFQRLIFVGLEVDPVGPNLKNLRHFPRLRPAQTAKSGAPCSPGTFGIPPLPFR